MKVKRKSAAQKARDRKMYQREKRQIKDITDDILEMSSAILRSNDLIQSAVAEMESYIEEDVHLEYRWQTALKDVYIDEKHINKLLKKQINQKKNIEDGLCLPNFDIIITKDAVKQMKKFDKTCADIRWNTCHNCGRSFPELNLKDDKCMPCNKHPDRWTARNEMYPGVVPPELDCLTEIESMIIAQIHPLLSVYRHKGGQHLYRGNVINFPQNIDNVVKVLPHIPASIPFILILHRKIDKEAVKFEARPEKLKTALLWLKNNNKFYKDIEISEDNLAVYPQDGDITHMLRQMTLTNSENLDSLIEDQLNSFVPDLETVSQDEMIYRKLNIPYPSLESTPINEFCKDGYISRAFPVLFPYGSADFSDIHQDDDITFTEYCKFLLQYKDGRFARDYRLRYFLLNTQLRHKMLSQASMYIKQGHWQNDDLAEFKVAVQKNPKIIDGIMSFNKRIQTTSAFWKTKCGELLSMCTQIGDPTIFFTLSAADYHWPDLFALIAPTRKFEDLTENDRLELMHQNPILSGYFFQYRTHEFIKLVLKPLFNVIDYWHRYEWQGRGSPHTHGVLWLSDAPKCKQEDNITEEEKETMIKYFNSMVFAVIPELQYGDTHPSQKKFSDIDDLEQENDMKQLITHVQRHTKCGSHCLRRNVVTQQIACRYNFPAELQDKSDINDDAGYLRYFPKRNDELIQRYSSIILKSWRANHDFSPICSTNAVLYYVAKYISKSETMSKSYETLIKQMCYKENDSSTLKHVISSLFIKSLGERDISAQEVCHLLMGWPLVNSSRTFITLNLFDEKWDNLEIVGSKVKINKSAIIDNYRNRPMSIDDVNTEKMSLLQFTQNYGATKNTYFKYKKSRIVRIVPILKLKVVEETNEPYYRQECIKHIPFRCEPQAILTDLKIPNINTWKKLYEHNSLESVLNNNFQDVPEDQTIEIPVVDDGIRQNLVEMNWGIGNHVTKHTIGRRLKDLDYKWDASRLTYPSIEEVNIFLDSYKTEDLTIPICEDITFELSNEQKKVLSILDSQMKEILTPDHTKLPAIKQCIVQGKAGSGKSTLINEMVKKIKSNFGEDSVSICAPTGAAAININGNTFHSEFRLAINPLNIEPLTGSNEKKFQKSTQNLKFVIIDEMSMIGAKRLWQINCRLRQCNPKSKEPFGGLYIYFFGDFRQLPPVQDIALYSQFTNCINAAKGLKLFQSLKNRIELISTYRQAEDVRFAQLVDRLGSGTISENDYRLLSTRNITALEKNELKTFENAIYLCATNDKVTQANYNHLENLGAPIAEIMGINKPNILLKSAEDDAGYLPPVIYLSIGCRVMLTKNLWTKAGLVNGALGTVTEIIYEEGKQPPELPLYILVKFDKYYGRTFVNESVPIVPENIYWTHKNVDYFRRQYPIILTYANSIHKGQGLTLPKVIIDIGEKEFSFGISYVAITRAKKLTDIVFKPFFPMKRLLRLGNSSTMNARSQFLKSFINEQTV